MNRRYLKAFVTLAFCGFVTVCGCETLQTTRQAQKTADRDPDVKHADGDAVESDSEKILDVKSDSKKSKPFFSGSRLSSGLSSEAREIEGDLGIH